MTAAEIAVHESGHAVVAVSLGLHLTEVILEDAGGGHAKYAGGLDLFEYAPTETIVAFLAGYEAQKLFTPTPDLTAAREDHAGVKLVLSSLDSLHDPRALDAQFQRLQQLAAVHTRMHWKWIERTARELTRRRRLVHHDVMRLRRAR